MSKWQEVKLGKQLKRIRTGKLDANASSENGIYPFFTCSVFPLKIGTYSYDCECVLVAGNGALNVKYYNGKFDAYQRTYILEVLDKNILNTRYLYYFMKDYIDILRTKTKGGVIKYIRLNDIADAEIPLPPMEEQKKIAARLDAVSDLLAKQKQLLSEQDNLIQSTFYDMFGDPIKNEKGWNSKKLSELGSLKNGINFQKNDNESDLYCLGVADFKDNKYISDISALQKVPSKSVNLTEDLLKNGDIVFVRSNGNKALVGRCVAVYPNEEAVTFSGFCIRFRKSTTLIKTDYLLYFLKTPQVRNALAGRGANIQNLNQQILSRVNILCPPLELQQKFAAVAEQIESEKSKIKSAIAETQTLFNSMMSEYFEE